ncbi:putative E3 ubiquitin-protein ligase ARI8 [Apium graveolens]|uniref:putative E3 ubiquitin-protein ligase ARI8 n=1 Tax=Apium graveolens TaxID=4045 RepID=UPI003D7B03CD
MDNFWCEYSSDDECSLVGSNDKLNILSKFDLVYESAEFETYRVLNQEDIQRNQERDILKVSSALSVSKYAAAIMLHKYAWNVKALLDAWADDEDGAREYVGLQNKPAFGLQESGESSICGMCFKNCVFDKRFENSVGFCGHKFCTPCLETYVSKAIDDGPEACLFLRCPDSNCCAVIGQDRVNMLVSDEGKMKYKEFLIRSYVEDDKNIEWCPAPNCECAILYLGGGSYDVTCRCLSSFCWNCLEEAHSPVDCESAGKWMLKNSSEPENVIWILANTQPCPNCKVLIEKDGDPLFVSCHCGHSFCWTCLGPLKCHGISVCVYRDKYANERVRNRFKGSNMRYVYYWERWDVNHKAQEKELADLCKIRNGYLVEELEAKHCRKVGGFKFLTEAWKQIVECRRFLKWASVYGYYMPERESAKAVLFEYLQGEAEKAFERLHDSAEKTLKLCLNFHGSTKELETLGIDLIDQTASTRKRFKNFLQGISDGLTECGRQSMESKKENDSL